MVCKAKVLPWVAMGAVVVGLGCSDKKTDAAPKTTRAPTAPTSPTPTPPPTIPPPTIPEPAAPSPNEVDQTLAQAVRKALVDDLALTAQAREVEVSAENGVVTLRGTVATDAEKSSVEAVVAAVPGVVRVDNQVEVRPG